MATTNLHQMLLDQIRNDLKAAQDIPLGTQAVSIVFNDPRADGNRPADDPKWCASLCRWDGKKWRRTRRVTGPLKYEDALDKACEIAKQRNINRV